MLYATNGLHRFMPGREARGRSRARAVKRVLALGVAAAVVFTAAAASSPPPAEATVHHFCGRLLAANEICGNGWMNHWQRVRSRYLGHQSHNVNTCVSMRDWTGNWLNGTNYCAISWSSPTMNPIGHNYGTGSIPSGYESAIWNWTWNAHSFQGWTSDNQTDG